MLNITPIVISGNADSLALSNSELMEIYQFIGHGDRENTSLIGLFNSSKLGRYRAFQFILPSEDLLRTGETLTLEGVPGEDNRASIQEFVTGADDFPQAGYGRFAGSIKVVEVKDRVVTLDFNITSTAASGDGTGTVRLTGTVILDFERQPPIIPPEG